MSIDFGYYPHMIDLQGGDVTIRTLSGLDDSIRAVGNSGCVEKSWYFAPSQYVSRDGENARLPYSIRIFGLPNTHNITHTKEQSRPRLRFLMHCFGFFVGMRMDDTGSGFLDATPLKGGTLNDFYLSRDSLAIAIKIADCFWERYENNPRIAVRLLGVLKGLSSSHIPTALEHERFIWSYIAIEGVYAACREAKRVTGKGGHGDRIADLCDKLEIPVPIWATNKIATNVIPRQNEAIHEGVFLEQPLGYQSFYDVLVPEDERHITNAIPFAMRNFVCRLIIALLEVPAPLYLNTETYSRGITAIDL